MIGYEFVGTSIESLLLRSADILSCHVIPYDMTCTCMDLPRPLSRIPTRLSPNSFSDLFRISVLASLFCFRSFSQRCMSQVLIFLKVSSPGSRAPASTSDFPPVFHFISHFRHFRPVLFTYY